MATLRQLIDQRAKLEVQINEMQTEGRAAAIAEIRKLMEDTGLTPADLQDDAGPAESAGRPKGSGKTAGAKVAAKYRHPDTGETWSGRGLKPKWLTAALSDGKKTIEDFAIG